MQTYEFRLVYYKCKSSVSNLELIKNHFRNNNVLVCVLIVFTLLSEEETNEVQSVRKCRRIIRLVFGHSSVVHDVLQLYQNSPIKQDRNLRLVNDKNL